MEKITECPHCGHHTFYTKQKAGGTVQLRTRFDGEEADNTGMYDLVTQSGGKYGYCEKCGKRICTADGYAINQEG